ncbi:hypothetical protein EBB59_02430 [Lysobacter pythonis]|uniref:Dicarboxylate transport domain-containing protein n=1 Tax=Solilutibacter pythonis TaxID=2483112 RepID=A0A3M2I7T2_9GAMM|nr:hypothetical protein EBB59_02430 [Lysobacter pythonis]
MAVLEEVSVLLDWPAGAAAGGLRLRARRVRADDLGYRFDDLDWRCPLRPAANGGWRCEGTIAGRGGAPMRLALRLDDVRTDAVLSRGDARLALARRGATPDLTRIELTRVPVQWAAALAAQVWPAARLQRGWVDGALEIRAPARAPRHLAGTLVLRDGALQTTDAATVMQNLEGRFRLDYRTLAGHDTLSLDGALGGEALFGQTYLSLSGTPARFALNAEKTSAGGWRLPRLEWRDGGTLRADARIGFDAAGQLRELHADFSSEAAAGLRDRYLGGLLGQAGMGEVDLRGRLRGQLAFADGRLRQARAELAGVDLVDPRGRFRLRGVDGDVAFSFDAPVASMLRWRAADVLGLAFGPTTLPFQSRDGVLALQRSARLPIFGGRMDIHDLRIEPPRAADGLRMRFGLDLAGIDVGRMAKALGLPEFRGELNGEIPRVSYANDLLAFDGGLSIGVFDGTVQVTELSMERPFGTAPTLSADLDFNDLDLWRLTEVLGFGSITGRLDGRVRGLRLVNWTPVRFDALLVTDRKPGVRQRISQRAVQNISSVGDASLVGSLQGRLIGLFDDFGYARIGIRCRLENEVCAMGGLDDLAANTRRSDAAGFTIVEGAGLPRLTVVGYHRRVDWPTLLERLKAVGSGDLKPVIE